LLPLGWPMDRFRQKRPHPSVSWHDRYKSAAVIKVTGVDDQVFGQRGRRQSML
jgi:hypothetical protein